VSFQVAGHQTEHYRIQTPVYEGPLDLLLELIERAELDITTLALAQVTDQYLEYLKNLQEHNASEVSAFLVIAARLLQIKSAALLPRPSLDAPIHEEDPGEALARQLIIYKRFKELAASLAERDSANLRTYLRVVPPVVKAEARLDISDLTIHDLLHAARSILLSQPDLPALSRVVSKQRITIREKILSIVATIKQFGKTTFRSLLISKTDRLEWIVTFLAMLELTKRRAVLVSQSELFGDIQIEPVEEMLDGESEASIDFVE
jgi:segregation and condensation protein A